MDSATRFFIFLLVFVLTYDRLVWAATLDEVEGYEMVYHPEREDLLELRDSLSSTMNLHSRWTGPPCYKDHSRWIGITCKKWHVNGIDLRGIQLTGSLRPTAFQNVVYLTNLYLSDNALHGHPPTLEGLHYLQNVSLSGNRLSGSIPLEYAALPRLTHLELQDNLLNGTIPSFQQRSLWVFNVSYNFLEGKIPDTPILQRFSVSSYEHNLELCGRPLNTACPPPAPLPSVPTVSPPPSVPIVPPPPLPSSPSKTSGPKGLELWALVLVAVGAVMVPLMAIFCFLCYKRRRRTAISGQGSSKKASCPRDGQEADKLGELVFFDKKWPAFNIDELLRASAEVLGKGKLGVSYRAMLESGPVVVVKRFKDMGGLSKEFMQEMQMVGGTRHENLVEIIACYYSSNEKLIVYEHVTDGSLFQILHGNRGEGRIPLNWSSRLNIAKGIARGLAYLHHSLPSHRVPHAHLKSSNILIHRCDHQYYPKLTDFGFLPLLLSANQDQRLAIGRTPEFSQGRRLNHKADIYCFGLVLLEIITGQAPEEFTGDFPVWATSVISKDRSTDILDIEIVAEKERHKDMLKLMDIAFQCTVSEPGRRPNISVLVDRIQEISVESSREGTSSRFCTSSN